MSTVRRYQDVGNLTSPKRNFSAGVIMDDFGEWLGYCENDQAKEAYKQMVWYTEASTYLQGEYYAAMDAMKRHVSGIMCGVDSYGLNSLDAVKLSALDLVVDHGEPSDGMVSIS